MNKLSKNRKTIKNIYFSGLIICLSLGLVYLNFNIPPVTSIPKESTVWCNGFWNFVGIYNGSLIPWDLNPGYNIAFMYDTLFGYNPYTEEYIGCLGEHMNWAPDGTYLNITLHSEAKWSGPGIGELVPVNTPVSAYDVKWSFEALNNTKWGNFFEIIDFILVHDNFSLSFHLNEGEEYSKFLNKWLTSDVPILNQIVWTDIMTYYGVESLAELDSFEEGGFRNRWDGTWPYNDEETDTPIKWQVISGPYYPYEFTSWSEILIQNSEYWGIGVIFRDILGEDAELGPKPNDAYPKYIGNRNYSPSYHPIYGYLNGEIDYSCLGIVNIKDIQVYYPNIQTWYPLNHSTSYLAQGSHIELLFNLNTFPLSEPWFRRAISFAINTTNITRIASRNNWQIGSPTYLNIQNPDHAKYFNETIHDAYSFVFDPGIAVNLLESHNCTFIGDTWQLNVPTSIEMEYTDVNSSISGTQINLGPWEIITPMGWTDITWAAEGLAYEISTNFGIQTNAYEMNYESYIESIKDSRFNLSTFCSGPETVEDSFTMFEFHSSVENSTFYNLGNWSGPEKLEYISAFHQFSTAPNESIAIDAANTMQRIYAEQIPTLPLHVNCLWYQYSSHNWTGFQNSSYQHSVPVTVYTVNRIVDKQRSILNLMPINFSITNKNTFFVFWNHPSFDPFIIVWGILFGLPAIFLFLKKLFNEITQSTIHSSLRRRIISSFNNKKMGEKVISNILIGTDSKWLSPREIAHLRAVSLMNLSFTMNIDDISDEDFLKMLKSLKTKIKWGASA